jgi:hypothetical protein
MLTAPDGYSRKRRCRVPTRSKRNPPDCYARFFRYRPMTIEEGKNLSWYDSLHVLFQDGEIMRVRQNGAVKTWKRDPNRVEIPIKYGARSDGQFRSVSQSDGTMSALVVLLDENGNPTQSEDSATIETE